MQGHTDLISEWTWASNHCAFWWWPSCSCASTQCAWTALSGLPTWLTNDTCRLDSCAVQPASAFNCFIWLAMSANTACLLPASALSLLCGMLC